MVFVCIYMCYAVIWVRLWVKVLCRIIIAIRNPNSQSHHFSWTYVFVPCNPFFTSFQSGVSSFLFFFFAPIVIIVDCRISFLSIWWIIHPNYFREKRKKRIVPFFAHLSLWRWKTVIAAQILSVRSERFIYNAVFLCVWADVIRLLKAKTLLNE